MNYSVTERESHLNYPSQFSTGRLSFSSLRLKKKRLNEFSKFLSRIKDITKGQIFLGKAEETYSFENSVGIL